MILLYLYGMRTDGSREFEVTLRERGLTQEQAAQEIGTTQQTVSDWIAGGSTPRLKSLLLIQEKYGVDVAKWARTDARSARKPSKRRRSGVTRAVGAATGTEG